MKRSFGLTVLCLTVGLAGHGASAAERPTALVEDANGDIAGVEVMEYVRKGAVISVPHDGILVLSYLTSCVTETIVGAEVTIGVRESNVVGGRVERSERPCDGGGLLLAAGEAGKSGVLVTRGVSVGPVEDVPTPRITLMRTTPVLVMTVPGDVTFNRLDESEPPLVVAVPSGKLDMSKANTSLRAGATYRASANGHTIVVKVADDATGGGGLALGRLLRF